MTEILFLSHRIPYPPDKGDKIRSYNLLKALSARFVVHLGTFVDDPDDLRHVPELHRLCGETCILPLDPRLARIRSLRGLLDGSALTNSYYRNASMRKWVTSLSRSRSLSGVFVFSSSMAQYGEAVRLPSDAVRIIDFCDVDSDKWAQYARSHGQPLKWLYAREARLLAAAEAGFVREFDTSLVISEVEAEILRAAAGTLSTRIAVVPNGVDAAYFDPGLQHARPFPVEGRNLVFTGAMDYQANVDAVIWFAHEVFPMVRRHFPDVSFVIVGSNPASAVERLVALPGVQVTGRVPDVRPYLAHADVVVAPLRIARGVQNKVLEAFSMARPVVATPNALQGIPDAVHSGVYCCAEADDMANSILHVLQSTSAEPRGRQFVQQRFAWSSQTSRLFQYFNQAEPVGGARLAAAGA